MGGRFEINCPGRFLKNFKIVQAKRGTFKIFKNHVGDLSQKLPEPNMWFLVNHTKPTSTLYWMKLISFDSEDL